MISPLTHETIYQACDWLRTKKPENIPSRIQSPPLPPAAASSLLITPAADPGDTRPPRPFILFFYRSA